MNPSTLIAPPEPVILTTEQKQVIVCNALKAQFTNFRSSIKNQAQAILEFIASSPEGLTVEEVMGSMPEEMLEAFLVEKTFFEGWVAKFEQSE